MFSEAKCYKLLFDTLVLIINSFGFSNSTKEKIFLLTNKNTEQGVDLHVYNIQFSQNGQVKISLFGFF